jgi:putative FmdB family regulatory protein
MPIYEYKCLSCKAIFEAYRSIPHADIDVKCPKCGSQKTERLISRFFGKGTAGGSCGPSFSG